MNEKRLRKALYGKPKRKVFKIRESFNSEDLDDVFSMEKYISGDFELSKDQLSGVYDWDFKDQEFENCHFKNVNFGCSIFNKCSLKNVTFEECLFYSSGMFDCRLENCKFVYCDYSGLHLEDCKIKGDLSFKGENLFGEMD